MAVIEHLTITDPDSNGDGLVLINDTFTVRDCVVDFSAQPLAGLDECISTVNHAEAEIEGCTFRGSSKGALFGNGDYPDTDPGAQVYMHNCVMENCGRRFPEAQDGVKVILERCTIRNWGIKDRFDVRTFEHGHTMVRPSSASTARLSKRPSSRPASSTSSSTLRTTSDRQSTTEGCSD